MRLFVIADVYVFLWEGDEGYVNVCVCARACVRFRLSVCLFARPHTFVCFCLGGLHLCLLGISFSFSLSLERAGGGGEGVRV